LSSLSQSAEMYWCRDRHST